MRLTRALVVAVAAALAACAAAEAEQCDDPSADASSERFLIAWPCDPGECHIYFSQQRKALPTNVFMALATNRTLVLPPFTYYTGQAQVYTNVFKRQEEGVRPLFMPVSDMYDLSAIESLGVRFMELHEYLADGKVLDIDLAVLSKGLPAQHNSEGRDDPDADPSVLVPYPCKVEEGIAHNLSAVGSGELWGLPPSRVRVGELRCGYAMLARAWDQAGQQARKYGDVVETDLWQGRPVVALLGAGHQLHSHAYSFDVQQVLHSRLPFAQHLVAEAERFVAERIAPLSPRDADGAFVAVHWRHGDYVAYNLVKPVDEVVAKAKDALRMAKCDSCAVFLATNCKDESEIELLRQELGAAPLVRYEPPSGPAGAQFSSEGFVLALEQLIAARSTVFVKNGRSAVSVFIDAERRALGKPPSMSINL